MRIGIDAKWLFSGNSSGKVVVSNLLEEFLKISTNHEVFIFLKKEEKDLMFPHIFPHVKTVYVWGKNNQLSNMFCIRKAAKKLELDIILCFYFSPLIANIKRMVFVFDAIFISNHEYYTFKERLYFSTIKFLSSRADMVLTISKTEKTRLAQYSFCAKEKIEVIYLGISKKYKVKESYSKQEVISLITRYNLPEKFILYVGRINKRKNLLNMVKAVKYLKEKDIKLIIAGKEEGNYPILKNTIKELGLDNRIILLGYIDGNDLPILYSQAKVFCYVSYDEGFGMPPLESLASGVPVVVANAGSLPEVCGDAGVYCNPDDPRDIANQIDLLLSDSILYDKKKKSGIEKAKKYNWSESAKRLLEIFERVGSSIN
jgi:glycosyltransferase involved in cell wall biosynthesis